MSFIVFDTETTGLIDKTCNKLSAQPKIIEFAGIKLDDNLNEIDRMEFLLNPGIEISPKITELTTITNEDVEHAPTFKDKYVDLCNFFLGEKTVVAHNVEYDIDMLKFELARIKMASKFPYPFIQKCTVKITDGMSHKWLKLEELHELATGEPHTGAHRAMPDVEALVRCIKWLRIKNLM